MIVVVERSKQASKIETPILTNELRQNEMLTVNNNDNNSNIIINGDEDNEHTNMIEYGKNIRGIIYCRRLR